MLTSHTLAFVVAKFFSQKFGINSGCQTRNGPPKHGENVCFRLGDTDFRTGNLGRVPADKKYMAFPELVLLLGADAEGIAGQENHVCGMTGDTGNPRVSHELDRVSPRAYSG